jgi:uncharacterized membrane protein
MSENIKFISKEDSERLIELLDELAKILKDHPTDEMERLKNIREELGKIRDRIPDCHNLKIENCSEISNVICKESL